MNFKIEGITTISSSKLFYQKPLRDAGKLARECFRSSLNLKSKRHQVLKLFRLFHKSSFFIYIYLGFVLL